MGKNRQIINYIMSKTKRIAAVLVAVIMIIETVLASVYPHLSHVYADSASNGSVMFDSLKKEVKGKEKEPFSLESFPLDQSKSSTPTDNLNPSSEKIQQDKNNQTSGEKTDSSLTEEQKPEEKPYELKNEDFEFDKTHGEIIKIRDEIVEQHHYLIVKIPEKIDEVFVSSIRPFAFYGNAHIKKADFSSASHLRQIGSYAFAFTDVGELNLEKNAALEIISNYAFFGTKLNQIVLSDPAEYKKTQTLKIGAYAFGNISLTENERTKVLEAYRRDEKLALQNRQIQQNVFEFDSTIFSNLNLKDQKIYESFEKAMRKAKQDDEKYRVERERAEAERKNADSKMRTKRSLKETTVSESFLNRNLRTAAQGWSLISSQTRQLQNDRMLISNARLESAQGDRITISFDSETQAKWNRNESYQFATWTLNGASLQSVNPGQIIASNRSKANSSDRKIHNVVTLNVPSGRRSFNIDVTVQTAKRGGSTPIVAARASGVFRFAFQKPFTPQPPEPTQPPSPVQPPRPVQPPAPTPVPSQNGNIQVRVQTESGISTNNLRFNLVSPQHQQNYSYFQTQGNIRNIPAGVYNVEMTKLPPNTYSDPASATVTIEAGQTATVNFVIRKRNGSTPSRPQMTITGTVVDAQTRRGISGVTLKIKDSSGRYVRDSSGREIEFRSNASGQVTQQVEKPLAGNYIVEPVRVPQGYSRNASSPLTITSGQSRYTFNMGLARETTRPVVQYTISGSVVDASNSQRPISGVTLELYEQTVSGNVPVQKDGVPVRTITDREGHFTVGIPKLLDGHVYQLVATSVPSSYEQGYVTISGQTNKNSYVVNMQLAPKRASADYFDVTVIATEEGSDRGIANVQFKLVDSDGRDVAAKNQGSGILITDSSGRATVRYPRLGNSQYRIVPVSYPSGYSSPNEKVFVPNGTSVTMRYVLGHYSNTFEVRVIDKDTQRGVAGTRLRIKYLNGTYVQNSNLTPLEFVTDQNGETKDGSGHWLGLPDLDRGNYLVEVIPPTGYSPNPYPDIQVPVSRGNSGIRIPRVEVYKTTTALPNHTRIQFVATEKGTNAPVANVQIRIRKGRREYITDPSTGTPKVFVTNREGKIDENIPMIGRGRYTVEIVSVPNGYNRPNSFYRDVNVDYAKTVNFGGVTLSSDRMKVHGHASNTVSGQGVPGVVFQLKSALGDYVTDSRGTPLRFTTDRNGDIKDTDGNEVTIVKLPAGQYTIVTTVPDGYQQYPDQKYTVRENDDTIGFNVRLAPAPTTGAWIIRVRDDAGNPLNGKQLNFFTISGQPLNDTSTGRQLQGRTDYDGTFTVYKLPAGTYRVRFPGDSDYEAVEKTVDVPAKGIETELITRVKGENGTITGYVHTAESKPVGGITVEIYRKSDHQKVSSGTTQQGTGRFVSERLPYGQYDVKIIETPFVKIDASDQSTKEVSISASQKSKTASFTVTQKQTVVSNAGSIKIEGKLVGKKNEIKTSWIVTVNQDATGSATKRGPINRIRIPVSELSQPSKPQLTIRNADGSTTTQEAQGSWIKNGDVYEFIDDHSAIDQRTNQQRSYQYSFTAIANESAQQYHARAEVEFKSTDPREQIPKSNAEYELNKGEAKPSMDLKASGYGAVDAVTNKIAWVYDAKAKASTPGDMTLYLTLPENSGQTPLNGQMVAPNVGTITKPDGTPITDMQFDRTWDAEKNAWKVVFHVLQPQDFNFKINFETGLDAAATVDEYPLDAKATYNAPDTEEGEETILNTRMIAGATTLPQSKTAELISPCEAGKHRINLQGSFSEDGKSIIWVARLTNISHGGSSLVDFSNYVHPATLDIQVGEGLGNAQIIDVQSVGKTFPYIRNTLSTNRNGNFIYDSKEGSKLPNQAGKNFSLHADYTNSFMTNTSDEQPHVYSYITGYSNFNPRGTEKTDALGNKYYFTNSFNSFVNINISKLSSPEYQRLSIGEYMTVTFKTPITDFSRLTKKGSDGEPLGYQINTHAKMFSYGGKDNTDTATPLCQSSLPLKLTQEKRASEDLSIHLIKDGVGEIFGSGKYINDGNDIEWKINVRPLAQSVSDYNAARYFRIRYKLVDSDNNENGDTGLGSISNRHENAVWTPVLYGKGSTKHTSQTGDGGEFLINDMYLADSYDYVFTTHVGQPKRDYRLKIEGYGGLSSSDLKPLTNDVGSSTGHIDYVIVEGRVVQIRIDKEWQNVYDKQKLPPIKLRLYQTKIDGTVKELSSATVETPDDPGGNRAERYRATSYTFTTYIDDQGRRVDIPRFDENGFKYGYYVTEDEISHFKSEVVKLVKDGSLYKIVNTYDGSLQDVEDPIHYVNEADGRYADPYIQSGPDIRNVETRNMKENPRKELYKLFYPDSILSKSGKQTGVPGQFDMKLTIEGNARYQSGELDVVFVVDNTNSMNYRWGTSQTFSYSESKIKTAKEVLQSSIDQLLSTKGTRIGIVNFATSTQRLTPSPVTKMPENPNGPRRSWTYNRFDEAQLTSDKNILEQTIPTVGRVSSLNEPIPNPNGDVNFGDMADGLTNIAAGISRGMEVLYPESEKGRPQENRQKLLIVISDGAPTASLKLKHYPLDTSLSLEENLQKSNPRSNRSGAKYIDVSIANNRNQLHANTYVTQEGVVIDNHMTATIAVADYYKKLHPSAQIYSIGVDPDSDRGADGQNRGAHFMEDTLRGITTDSHKNYYTAQNSQAFLDYVAKLRDNVKTNAILDGEVVDPMGNQIILADILNDQRFTPASSPALNDGDYFLEDNQGNYLKKDGSIFNYASSVQRRVRLNMYYRDGIKHAHKITDSPVEFVLDSRGQPVEIPRMDNNYRMLGGTEQNAYDTNASRGVYKYIVAVNHRGVSPEKIKLGYHEGHISGFTPLMTLQEVLEAIEDGKNLILIKNANIGGAARKKPFIRLDGQGEYPKTPSIAGGKNLLQGVQVIRENNGLKIQHLNLGLNEEVRLYYRIHLNTETENFVPNFYYPANKTTTLNPQPAKGTHYRYFPIPSVKAPAAQIHLEKFWLKASGENMTDKERQQWLKDHQLSSLKFDLIRYEAMTDAQGRPVNSQGVPLGYGEHPVPKYSTGKVVRELELNEAGHWQADNEDLTAYRKDGTMYLYTLREKSTSPNYDATHLDMSPLITYDAENGYQQRDPYVLNLDRTISNNDRIHVAFSTDSESAEQDTTLQSNTTTLATFDLMKVDFDSVNNRILIRKAKQSQTEPIPAGTLTITLHHGNETKRYQLVIGDSEHAKTVVSATNTVKTDEKGKLILRKRDGKNTSTFLKDAVFRLQRKDGQEAVEKSSNEQGYVVFNDLKPGIYTVREIRAPSGYVLPHGESYEVTIGSRAIDGVLPVTQVIRKSPNTDDITVNAQHGDGAYPLYYEVLNYKVDIPYTGFIGGIPWLLLGISVSILAFAYYVYRENSREGGGRRTN